jgi:hypothetical protein
LLEYEHGGKTLLVSMPMLWLEQLLISIKNRHCFETWRKNRKLNCKLEENKELKLIILAEAMD